MTGQPPGGGPIALIWRYLCRLPVLRLALALVARSSHRPAAGGLPLADTGDRSGRRRLDAGRDRAGAADDAGARLLLRRPGALEERAQHDDDELRGARASSAWPGRSSATRWRSPPGTALLGGLSHGAPARRRARGAGHDPAPALHVLPGHVRDHHRRAHLGRDRRAHALRRLPRCSSRSGASSSTRRSRTGCGAAAGSPRSARSTSPAAPSSTSTPRRRRSWRRSCSGRARTTRARRSCRTTSRSRCSAPACSGSAGSASTRGSALAANAIAALAFTNTLLAPAATLRRLDAARPAPRRQGHRGRRRHRRSSSAWWRSRRRPASSGPLAALALGAIAAVPSYFALLCRARTRLDDSLDVVAAHGLGGAIGALLTGVFAGHGLERRRRRRCSPATRASSASRRSACWRRSSTAASATLRAARS